jgi:Domain of unknown function (DUF4352)
MKTPSTPPQPAEPAAPLDRRARLIRWYAIGVAVGIVLLVATVAWALLRDPSKTVDVSSPSTSGTATAPAGQAQGAPANLPAAAPSAPGEVVNVNLAFQVTGVDSAPTVTSPADDLLTKEATGKFVIVSLVVRNTGNETSYYMSNQQKLKSGSDTFEADPEASNYLGSLYEELNPGDRAQVALVFDVPPGTVPDALEVHGDAVAPGTDLPLR